MGFFYSQKQHKDFTYILGTVQNCDLQLTPVFFLCRVTKSVKPTDLGCSMGVCLVLQQQLGDVDVVVVSGHVQRGQAVLALYVRVGILLQQQTRHLDVAVLGSNVQWGEALL